MDRRTLLATLATGTTGAIAGCNSGLWVSEADLDRKRATLEERTDAVVGMVTPDNLFDPALIEVSVGDTVAWINDSEWSHTVTARADKLPDEADFFTTGGFDTEDAAADAWPDGDLAAGETFVHTFEVPGTYPYYCIPHEGMTGTVVVAEDTTETS